MTGWRSMPRSGDPTVASPRRWVKAALLRPGQTPRRRPR
jgi:hypothetical protein